MKKVAIVIPVYKSGLDPSEQISLHHLERYCSQYDWFLVYPEGLEFNYETHRFHKKPLAKHYFTDIASYNELCVTPSFYELFSDYKYILIYQLDAYIFKDELEYWCDQNYSYIGAPWLKSTFLSRLLASICKRTNIPYCTPYRLAGVGNGGLSLRHVKHTIDVLKSNSLNWLPLLKLYNPFVINRTKGCKRRVSFWWLLFEKMKFRNKKCLAQRIIKKYNYNEDSFFQLYSSILNKNFRFPSPEIANLFAFDGSRVEQRIALNHSALPFGAHGCFKYKETEEQYRKYFNFIEQANIPNADEDAV